MYETMMTAKPQMTRTQIDAVLRTIEPFASLPAADRTRLSGTIREYHFARGETLFEESQGADSVWLIVSGSVAVYKYASAGKRLAVETLRKGDLCGALCRVAGRSKVYPCSAAAAEPTTALKISDRAFFPVIDGSTKAMAALCALCSSRLIEAQEMRRIDSEPATVRVAHLLLQRGGEDGRVTLTKREIAEHIGATQETAFRVLASFQRRGLIKSKNRLIQIADAEGLARAAGR
jgi:CRP-like cAMP-binding protein